MNRLVLLGNGFDLAHGLNTGYNDFLRWYLTTTFWNAQLNQFYKDDLINIKRLEYYGWHYDGLTQGIPEFIDFYYEQGFVHLITNRPVDVQGTRYQPMFEVKVTSKFLELLLLNCNHANWVDIENEYYAYLKVILKEPNTDNKRTLLGYLNNNLRFILNF